MIWRRSIAAILPFVALTGSLAAQSPPADLALERSECAEWLAKAPNSPLAAVAQQPIGPGIRLGPTDADVPLAGVAEHRVTERGGAVTLEGPQGARPLPVGRPIALGEFFVTSAGLPGRRVLTVFACSAPQAATKDSNSRANKVRMKCSIIARPIILTR